VADCGALVCPAVVCGDRQEKGKGSKTGKSKKEKEHQDQGEQEREEEKESRTDRIFKQAVPN